MTQGSHLQLVKTGESVTLWQTFYLATYVTYIEVPWIMEAIPKSCMGDSPIVGSWRRCSQCFNNFPYWEQDKKLRMLRNKLESRSCKSGSMQLWGGRDHGSFGLSHLYNPASHVSAAHTNRGSFITFQHHVVFAWSIFVLCTSQPMPSTQNMPAPERCAHRDLAELGVAPSWVFLEDLVHPASTSRSMM